MQKEKRFCLFILGPTGVGKTDLSLTLAEHIPAEIINGDSGQFYTPFSIGTAKLDWKNEKIPHHLFDIIDEPKDFSVVEYRKMLLEKIDDICSKGKLPIVVGGSGFYLKSIFFPPSSVQDVTSKEKVARIDDPENKKKLASKLWEELNQIDPKRAEQIHKNDLYRIQRALSIWFQTGKKAFRICSSL